MAEPMCPGCRQRDAQIADLQRRVADLEALARELSARLGVNTTNSSTPPSANPPAAPRLPPKKPTGRSPGGQPGHPAHLRRRLPPERVRRAVTFAPTHCDRCPEPLPPPPPPDDPPP